MLSKPSVGNKLIPMQKTFKTCIFLHISVFKPQDKKKKKNELRSSLLCWKVLSGKKLYDTAFKKIYLSNNNSQNNPSALVTPKALSSISFENFRNRPKRFRKNHHNS